MGSLSSRAVASSKGGRRLDVAALAVLLLSGVSFCFLTPPFQVPDEAAHFYRAFEVSEGRLVPTERDGESGDFLPRSLPALAARLQRDLPFHAERKVSPAWIRSAREDRLEPERRRFVGFLTSAYSFVPYLPSAAGIGLARLFSDSVLVLFYAGRLSNVVVSALLFFGAIRRTPLSRPVFFLLSLAPMAVFEMASLSADAFTNGFSFFFIAVVLGSAFGEARRPGAADRAKLLTLSAAAGLTKSGWLLPALFFLVPAARFGSARRRGGFVGLMLGASAATMLAWSAAIWKIYPRFHPGGTLDPGRQLSGVLAHPLIFAGVTLSYYVRQAPVLANQYIGKLGWVDTRLPPVFVVAFFLLLLLVAATCGCRDPEMKRGQRLTLLLVLCACVAWITALLYVLFTPVGAAFIESTQGRYFIPLGPLAFLMLHNRRLCIPWEKRGVWIVGWGVLSGLVAAVCIARRFYG